MKIYVNPMSMLINHTIEEMEKFIREDVIDYFGTGGDDQKKYVVVDEMPNEEDDEEKDVLMFEGTLEECYTYSEFARFWIECKPAIYSEQVYRKSHKK